MGLPQEERHMNSSRDYLTGSAPVPICSEYRRQCISASPEPVGKDGGSRRHVQ